jgi:hypothetical protein
MDLSKTIRNLSAISELIDRKAPNDVMQGELGAKYAMAKRQLADLQRKMNHNAMVSRK